MSGRRPFFYSFDLTTGKIIRIKGITGLNLFGAMYDIYRNNFHVLLIMYDFLMPFFFLPFYCTLSLAT